MLGGLGGVERADLAHHLVDGPEAQLRIISRASSAMNMKKFSTNSGLPANRCRSNGLPGLRTHRAGVQVTHPHHDAAGHHQRRGSEAELLGAEQRGDHDVAPGLELAVDLHDDAVA